MSGVVNVPVCAGCGGKVFWWYKGRPTMGRCLVCKRINWRRYP